MLFVTPVLIGVALVAVLSLIPERTRRPFSAVFLAGAGAAYLSSTDGFGPWELVFTAVMTIVAFKGLKSYRWIGVGWLLHTAWDAAHAAKGSPILPFAEHSSLGCAICDPVLALWYLAGAPSLSNSIKFLPSRTGPQGAGDDDPVPRPNPAPSAQ